MNMPMLKAEAATAIPLVSAEPAEVVQPEAAQRRASGQPACCRALSAFAAARSPAADALSLILLVWETAVQPARRHAAGADQDLDGGQGPDRRSVLRHRPAGHRARLARADVAAARRHRLRPRRPHRHRARHPHRPVGVGHARARPDLPGAAHRPAAGLAADLAGRLPRQPAFGDLRDLHHLGLADHHQHRGRHPQHPAGLPQRRAGAAAEPARVLLARS